MKQTTIQWLFSELERMNLLNKNKLVKISLLKETVLKMELYHSKVEAKKYFLRGFEDAELTQNPGVSHEQTMRDAETLFELLYPLIS
jgi:hypothetical protein